MPAKTHRKAKSRPTEDPRFAEFWAAYPRREKRKDAADAFAKLAPNQEEFAGIMAALDRQKRSPRWAEENGKFVPHATTWLNGRRWEDEPPGQPASQTARKSMSYEEAQRMLLGEGGDR